MPQVHLDETEVHAVFQQMGGVGMPQRVHMRALVHPALAERPDERRLQARTRNRPGAGGHEVPRALADGRGKQPLRGAMGAPVLAQHRQGIARDRHIPVAPPLPVNVQQPTGAIHVGDLEVGAFLQAQAAHINRGQACPVDR